MNTATSTYIHLYSNFNSRTNQAEGHNCNRASEHLQRTLRKQTVRNVFTCRVLDKQWTISARRQIQDDHLAVGRVVVPLAWYRKVGRAAKKRRTSHRLEGRRQQDSRGYITFEKEMKRHLYKQTHVEDWYMKTGFASRCVWLFRQFDFFCLRIYSQFSVFNQTGLSTYWTWITLGMELILDP